MRAADFIEVFEDTQRIIKDNEYLSALTERSVECTRVYDKGFHASERKIKGSELNISVINGSTFNTARTFTTGRVAVLNFANPYEPGGGVKRGARAQEECLCRCSNLYNTLCTEKIDEAYYSYHKERRDDYLFSDKLVYSPDVSVVKTDSYERLDEPFRVDVITCAAPYNVYGFDRELLKTTYESRITNILESAIDNDVDTIILGAFGCGVFHNPPELMADAFRRVLVDDGYCKFFKNVVFAIINANIFDRNLAMFQEIFESN